jgi:hypothetical protein
VQEAATQALDTLQEASQALVPANLDINNLDVQSYVPKDVVVYAKKASNAVVWYTSRWQARADGVTGRVRDVSVPVVCGSGFGCLVTDWASG